METIIANEFTASDSIRHYPRKIVSRYPISKFGLEVKRNVLTLLLGVKLRTSSVSLNIFFDSQQLKILVNT
jgi:hypothetical protein